MSIPAKANVTNISEAVESVLVQGDLAKLNPQERVNYYQRVCHSLGLNPLTQPFAYISLNGKLTLYAKRDCADQLRKINGISIEIVSQEVADGLLTVHVRATDASGRKDEDLGVVPFPETIKGEARANQILKAVTKAKRRVTLSISGLGFLDETEVESIRNGGSIAPPETGELITQDQAESLLAMVNEVGADPVKFCKYLKVPTLLDLPASRYDEAVQALEAKRVKK